MSGGGGNFFSQLTSPVGQIYGGLTGATNTANALQGMANAQLQQQASDRQQALGYASSPQELQQLQSAITTNNQDIARKQQLLSSVDPALMEAGKQALSLMQGQSAASLGPLQNQIASQRQQMQASLSNQLGPDWATSSAGQAAMNSFNQQAQNQLTNAQQSTLSMYLGSAGNTEGQASLQPNIANQNAFASQYGNIASRQISALTGAPISAGMSQVGALANAQSNQLGIGTLLGSAMNGSAQNSIGNLQSLGGMFSGGGGSSGSGMMAGGGDAAASGGASASTMMAFLGGEVPGKAKVKGDSSENDDVQAMLSPGEVVLPRSVTMGNNPGLAAKQFVERQLAKQRRQHA